MVTTPTAKLYVSEPCLPKGERETLRHFLGLLLDADEPEAMVASLSVSPSARRTTPFAARWSTAKRPSVGSPWLRRWPRWSVRSRRRGLHPQPRLLRTRRANRDRGHVRPERAVIELSHHALTT